MCCFISLSTVTSQVRSAWGPSAGWTAWLDDFLACSVLWRSMTSCSSSTSVTFLKMTPMRFWENWSNILFLTDDWTRQNGMTVLFLFWSWCVSVLHVYKLIPRVWRFPWLPCSSGRHPRCLSPTASTHITGEETSEASNLACGPAVNGETLWCPLLIGCQVSVWTDRDSSWQPTVPAP